MDLRLRSRMLRCVAATAACAAIGVPIAMGADGPEIDRAVGLSRKAVRVAFTGAVGSGALQAGDFSLSMGNEPRTVTGLALAADRRSAVLRSSSRWPYGTAGTVSLSGGAPVRVWASPGDTKAPVLSRVRLDRTVLCSKAVSSGCARSGGTVRFRVSEPATIVLDLRKRGSTAPSTEKYPAARGDGAISFHEKIEGLRLRPGRFVLAVTAVDAAGNESQTVALPLRVRR